MKNKPKKCKHQFGYDMAQGIQRCSKCLYEKPKPTVAELQAILDNEEESGIVINPDGSINSGKRKRGRPRKVKVLTMKEALGGEYGLMHGRWTRCCREVDIHSSGCLASKEMK